MAFSTIFRMSSAAQALQTIGVALADHIIVADDDFVSMAQSGYLTSWEHL